MSALALPIASTSLPLNKEQLLAIAREMMDESLVRIDQSAIASADLRFVVARQMELNVDDLTRSLGLRECVKAVLCANAINHRFWRLSSNRVERYSHLGRLGAMGMREGLSSYFCAWRESGFAPNFASESALLEHFGDIPDARGRADILRQCAQPGLLDALADAIEADAADGALEISTAALIAQTLPLGYSDPLLKKAQLALSEIAAGYSQSHSLVSARVSAFADYQIPKVLRALGALVYSPELAAKIDRLEPLPEDSPEERALRGASVLACEALALASGADAAQVDFWIWSQKERSSCPFHLTYTRRY